ncbi:Nodule Cysteine-Rich (NCR) secreted peptide [Medicago truncatula]|nr:Nodule Cysteine-Rich (NCR) secreted peptide [Medicago truncatula]
MSKILKFIYATLVLYLFLVVTKASDDECKIDGDCPISWQKFHTYKCINQKCKWVLRFHEY